MAEYIDVEKARAYVENKFRGDPVLQWLGRTMIEKLPKVEHEAKQPCHMCDSAFVNEELTRDNDLSYVWLGSFLLGYRAMIRSGDGKPVEIITEYWDGRKWEEVGWYHPKFCPNCGRELVENQQFKTMTEGK